MWKGNLFCEFIWIWMVWLGGRCSWCRRFQDQWKMSRDWGIGSRTLSDELKLQGMVYRNRSLSNLLSDQLQLANLKVFQCSSISTQIGGNKVNLNATLFSLWILKKNWKPYISESNSLVSLSKFWNQRELCSTRFGVGSRINKNAKNSAQW